MSETPLSAPRGMRDFYPHDMAVRNAIFSAWAAAARRFGFVQYDACVVESLDLLKRKAGEEIVEQIYSFKDKSDRELALRAEMTPTLARMIVARQNELAFPLKWFAVVQCFRYERMSKGRKREHYQWNLDIVGENSMLAETEVIAAALQALAQLGLDSRHVRVHVNSRALLSDLLATVGIPKEHHAATFLALDKRGKVDDAAISTLLAEAGLTAAQTETAFRILRITTLDEAAAVLGASTPSLESLREFMALVDTYGLSDAVQFDIAVIRGLGYYTGLVFEAFDVNRKFRAIFGGGRYDNLLGDLGGRPMTAVGLGFGDVVVAELLAELGALPASRETTDMAIAYMEAAQRVTAVALAQAFRRGGQTVDLGLHPEKPKAFFGRVGNAGFRQAIYLGPDDVQKGAVRIKNLTDRSEAETPLADLLR